METKIARLKSGVQNGKCCVLVEVDRESFDKLRQIEPKVDGNWKMKIWKPQKKSRNANNYLWVMCDRIAQSIKGHTKEDIYRIAVKAVGKWYDGTFNASEMQYVSADWARNGIGWFAEKISPTKMRLYVGSQVYDQAELGRLIDFVVDEAKSLGIETDTPEEIAHIKSLWGGNGEL